MRISDWSSDVCSSDLTAPRFRLTTIRSRPERRLPRRHAPRAASRRRQGGGRQMLTRRSFFILGGPVALAAALFGPAGLRGALAHHGWRWAEDGNFELTGIIETVQLGNRSEEHTSELQSLMRNSY